MKKTPLERAVILVGGQSALAEALGAPITQAHVWKWLNGTRLTAEHAIPIERATQGRITRRQLRPDIYPKESAR